MANHPGKKSPLVVIPCDVKDNGEVVRARGKGSFRAMINPAGYTLDSVISYADDKAVGLGGEPKYVRTEAEKVTFKQLVLDGTGVVEGDKSVREQLEALRAVAYQYDGSVHQPRVVEVRWGPLVFRGRLQSMNVEFTLFRPDGEPLRAKLNLNFLSYSSKEQQAKKANLMSPDLTHHVTVQAGDTLPLLCHRIYRDCRYYIAVASFNGLRDFRQLQPGQLLRFPPLG